MFNSLQHKRLPCLSVSPGVGSNSHPLSQWGYLNLPSLCHPLLFLPLVFSSTRVFSNESALHIRWPNYWNFSFSIGASNEYSGLIAFRIDSFDFRADKRTLKSLLQHTIQKQQFFDSVCVCIWRYVCIYNVYIRYICSYTYFWTFYSLSSFYFSLLGPIIFIIVTIKQALLTGSVSPQASFFFFKVLLIALGLSHLQINFRIYLSVSTERIKTATEIVWGYGLNQ